MAHRRGCCTPTVVTRGWPPAERRLHTVGVKFSAGGIPPPSSAVEHDVPPVLTNESLAVAQHEVSVTDRSNVSVAADIAAARRGEPSAFGRLLRQWDHDMRGVAWAVVREQHAVDDVLQTAYEKAFRSIDGFAGNSSMKTWLHSIVYRAAIDHLRYEGRRRHEGIETLERLPSAGSVSGQATDHMEIVQALATLDHETRAMVMLTGVAGLSFDEVAEITGVARGTVASRVSRARARLREEVQS